MENSDEQQENNLQDNANSSERTRVGFPQARKEKKGRGTLVFIILAIIALLLVGAWLLFGRDQGEVIDEEPTPSIPEEVSSPTPTEVEIDREEITLQILNGSGISGAAGDLQQEMEDLGYSNIEVGNASSQNNETTEVTFSSGVPVEVQDEITDKLEEIYEDVDVQKGDTGEFDVEIITGFPKGHTPSVTDSPKQTSTPSPTSRVTGTVTPATTTTPTP